MLFFSVCPGRLFNILWYICYNVQSLYAPLPFMKKVCLAGAEKPQDYTKMTLRYSEWVVGSQSDSIG